MKTVDVFMSFGEHVLNDSRMTHYGLHLVKHGVKGVGKLNPYLVWFDAALSVMEATKSYFRYATECEKTKQLHKECDVLKMELHHIQKILGLELYVFKEHNQKRIHDLSLNLKLTVEKNLLLKKKIKQQLHHVKIMQNIVKAQRQELVTDFDALLNCQQALDLLIKSTLFCIINAVDN